jgi:glycosyltransferase involved in cell wall biosynthesis
LWRREELEFPMTASNAAQGDRPVVFITTTQQPYHPRHYHLMAVGLHRAGVPACVVAQPDHAEHPPGPVHVVFVRAAPGRLARFLSAPTVIREALALEPRVVHVTSLDLLPWAVLLRMFKHVPVLYDSNEDYPADIMLKEWLPHPARRILSRVVRRLEPWCAAHLDAVTLADDGTAGNFRGIDTPLIVVYNFPWLEMLGSADDLEPEFDVSYHGSLPQLYLDPLLATAQILDSRGVSARWCLVARDYREQERNALEDRIRGIGLSDRMTLRYNQPFVEMPKLLRASRLGFIPLPDRPKFHRNLPRKLFEYLAAGRPAVVSDLPPIRRLVGGAGCCLLVRPGDPVESADALQELLAAPDLAREMGARGRRLVAERLNAEHAVGPYIDLVQRLGAGTWTGRRQGRVVRRVGG